MNSTKMNKPKWIASVAFAITILITQSIAFKILQEEKRNELETVASEANAVKNQIETSLNHSVTAAKMLAFLVKKDLISDNFDLVSKDLMAQNKFIDALQLVEKSTIIKTYPLKGNENVIRYDIFTSEAHKKDALEAIQRKELYFEGPFELKQGGEAIVGRLPIYKEGSFWGFSAVIISKNTFLEAIGIDSSGVAKDFVYQIAKVDKEKETAFFFQHNQISEDGIFHKSFVKIGDWNIYVEKKMPEYMWKTLPFALLGVLFSLLVAYFSWNLAVQPVVLQHEVEKKTEELHSLNQILEKRAKELADSNKQLEQFAYVASHDLQEPLRMITGFLSQLEKKYNDKIDDRGKQYIHFAVDGAKRMRQIILDLLDFSRVGKEKSKPVLLDVNEVISEATVLLRNQIASKKASIQYKNLPEIVTYHSPLIQVFQNLIGNALKYSKEEVAPIIEITAEEQDKEWKFAVKDNGIGISQEFNDKIFIIFQRLHHKSEYSGTGMGLAIVKKIIEGLGGKIWVESEEGKGSIFYFTILKM